MPDQQQPPTDGQQFSGKPTLHRLPRPLRLTDIDDHKPRYVVHIPFNAATLGTALDFARVLSDILAFIPDVDQGETTITTEGNEQEHHQVICNRKTGNTTRCPHVFGHVDPCDPDPPQPTTPETQL